MDIGTQNCKNINCKATVTLHVNVSLPL